MTTNELKQKIIDKAAEMLENVKSCEELNQLAAAYNQLTANDTMKSMGEMLAEKTEQTEPIVFQVPKLPEKFTQITC